MSLLTRRAVMAASTGLFLARATATQGLEIRRAAPAEPFAMGVASGDPSTDGFVLWTRLSAGGASPNRAHARASSAWVASAVSGVFSLGFHTTGLPHTSASAAFQLHTATGKLKALITPTAPSGCHCSIMRWPGRSLAMVRPCSWRDKPTAKSQMSIISCTSPSPSERTLPASSDTSRPKASLCWRSFWPRRRTSSPRTGAGTARHCRKAACALSMSAWACALVWLGFYALRHGCAGLLRGEARLVWAMLACSLANQWLIHPVIERLKAMPVDAAGAPAQMLGLGFGPWHGVSSSVYLLQSLLGLAWVLWPRRRGD